MEEKTSANIVEQSLEHPIKYAIMLTKEVYSLNKGFFWGITALIIVLAILSNIQIVGLVASVVSGILMFALFLFTGKVFDTSSTMDMFVKEIESISISKLWNDYWKPALGAYLGWVIVVIALIILTTITFSLTGGTSLLMQDEPLASNLTLLLPPMILPLIILSLILYVIPLVFANTIRTDTFEDAFKSVFTLFQGTLWRRAFTGGYFKYMAAIGLVLIALIVGVSVASGLLVTLLGAIDPTMIYIGMILMVIVMVIFQVIINVFYAITAIIADRIATEQ